MLGGLRASAVAFLGTSLLTACFDDAGPDAELTMNADQDAATTTGNFHAARTAGDCAALPSQDPQGDGAPISSGEGAEAVADARRD